MANLTINSIREAEKKAKADEDLAKKQANELIKESQKKAENLEKDEILRVKAEISKKLSAKNAEADSYIEDELKKMSGDLDSLREKSKANYEKAVEAILECFT